MDHMANDPVCRAGSTALGNLLEIIKNQLLVVKLPHGLGTSINMSAMDKSGRVGLPGNNGLVLLSPPDSPPDSTPEKKNVPNIVIIEQEPTNVQLRPRAEAEPAIESDNKLPSPFGRGRARAMDFLKHMLVISGDEEDDGYWLTGTPKPPPDANLEGRPAMAQDGTPYQPEQPSNQLLDTQGMVIAQTERVSGCFPLP